MGYWFALNIKLRKLHECIVCSALDVTLTLTVRSNGSSPG